MNLAWMRKFEKHRQYPRHHLSHKSGGIHMNADDETKLYQLMSAFLKQIGGKVARGDFNLATLPKPILLTYPISLSECLACDYFYTDPYLNEAANCPDPLLRMQLVVTDLIASIHHTHVLLKSLAPVDCILGETVTRVKPDGTRFYSEFIKADPPTTIFQVYGPNDAWVMYGVDEVEAQIHPTLTQLIGRNKRPRYLKFRDGKIYEIWLPTMIVNGLMKGDRILNKMDMATVKCPQDKLVTQINFSYVFEGQMAKMKNRLMFWNQQEKPISDLVDVKINKIINNDDEEDEVFTLSQGSGSWLSHLQFDGDLYWSIEDSVSMWHGDLSVLPSDSKFREDIDLMLKGQNEQAQHARNQMEQQAYKDSLLRRRMKSN